MERYLDYDSAGFIVGINHVKDAIDSVQDDTQEIIGLMTAQAQIGQTKLTEISKKLSEANHHHRAAARKQVRTTSRISNVRTLTSPTSSGQSTRAVTARISSNQQITSPSQQPQNRVADPTVSSARISTPQDLTDQASNNQGGSNTPARRDSRGRFVSEGSTEQEHRLNAIARDMMNARIGVDSGGYDPLVDSVRELGTVMSPLGQVGKMGMRGVKFSVSKLKALKRREPLPQDQSRHNRENEVLLDKIWKAIRNIDSSGGGGGLLGGLLGGGGRRGGRGGRVGKLKNLAGRGFKAVGSLRGLSILSGLAGSAALAMDWDNLDHKGKSAGLGGLAGMSVGGVIGGTLGAVGGPFGMAAGAAIGGWLGSEGGEALGAAASPYIDSWSSSIVAYNLPKKMEDMWNEGIQPFFTTMFSVASNFYKSSLSTISSVVDNVGSFLEGGIDGITSKNAGANGASAAKLPNTQEKNQMMVYESFRNAGLSDSQARAMTAEVGRENSYQDKYLFGGHSDPANNEYNLGMFSWQKERGKKLYKYLDSKGLIRNGKIIQSQEALNEQAKFAVSEINNDKSYRRTKKEFLNNPNVSYQKASEVLGRNYIRWRYDDPKYSKHHKYRDQYKALIDQQLKPLEDTTIIDETKNKTGEIFHTAKNKASEIVNAVKDTITPDADNIANSPKNNRLVSGSTPARLRLTGSVSQNNITSHARITPRDMADLATTAASHNGYRSPRLPVIRPQKIPQLPNIQQRLDSGSAQKPIILQAGNDTIGQNVSDRGIAHAVTGGLGQDRYWV